MRHLTYIGGLVLALLMSKAMPALAEDRLEQLRQETPAAWQEVLHEAASFQHEWKKTVRISQFGEQDSVSTETGSSKIGAVGCVGVSDQESGSNARGVNLRYTFALAAPERDENWQVREIAVRDRPIASSQLADLTREYRNAMRSAAVALRVGYCILPEMWQDSSFRVESAEQDADTGRLVRVAFDYHPAEKNDFVRDGWVLLDPARKWTVVRFGTRGEWGDGVGAFEGKYTYARDGDLFPSRLETMSRIGDEGEHSGTQVFSITDFSFRREKLPDSAFSLTAFGLPEPYLPDAEQSRIRGLRYYLVIGGLLFLAIATAIVRWSRPAAA